MSNINIDNNLGSLWCQENKKMLMNLLINSKKKQGQIKY